MKKLFTLTLALLLIQAVESQTLTISQFATGFSSPVGVENAGDNRLFVLQQRGLIKIVNPNGSVNSTPFLDISNLVSQTGDERGLLGLAFHPDYENNGYFYINYTRSSNGATRISRFSVNPSDPNTALANSEVEIITISQPYSNHNGGQIRFGPDGYLYIGMGDGGSSGDPQNYAQNPMVFLGKMLRIDVDNGSPYSIPSSNPFSGSLSIENEIWAIGLRNPWRFNFDRCTGDLWIADVGQNAYEEIDFQPASSTGGENYGWRCYEGDHNYNTNGCGSSSNYTFPVFEYAQSGSNGCSVTGGFVYRGGQFGSLFGGYLHTDYCSGKMWFTEPDGNNGFTTSVLGTFLANQYTSFGEDYLGELYVVGRYNGILYKITANECEPTAFIKNGDVTLCGSESVELEAIFGEDLNYQWRDANGDINGATSSTYTTSTAGTYTVYVTKNVSCTAESAPITVTVQPLPTVSFSGLDVNYCINNATVTLTPNPAGGTFSGPGTSGNDFDPATAGVGTHDIVYTYTDGNGCTNSSTVQTTVNACTSIEEPMVFSRINLFPNPAESRITLEMLVAERSNTVWNIYTSTGQLVQTENKRFEPGIQKTVLDISSLSNGFYSLELLAGNGKTVKTFAVTK